MQLFLLHAPKTHYPHVSNPLPPNQQRATQRCSKTQPPAPPSPPPRVPDQPLQWTTTPPPHTYSQLLAPLPTTPLTWATLLGWGRCPYTTAPPPPCGWRQRWGTTWAQMARTMVHRIQCVQQVISYWRMELHRCFRAIAGLGGMSRCAS